MPTRASHSRFTSVRFRLTAWYAAVLITILLVLGVSFTWVLERQLRSDVDVRLEQAARDVKSRIEQTGLYVPPVRLFSFPNLLIQVVDADGTTVDASESLSGQVLPVENAPPGSSLPVFATVELNDVQIRTVRLPLVLTSSGETIGSVNIGEPLVQVDQTLDHVRRLLTVVAAVGVVLAAVVGYFLADRALRPVDRITATAAAIASDTGGAQLRTARLAVSTSRDELARLASTFNQMLDRLSSTFDNQQRFIADASHELRTPLTAIQGNIDVLSRQAAVGSIPPDDLAETLQDLRRESTRMNGLVEDLLTLARSEAIASGDVRLRLVSLDEVARDALRTAASLASGQRLSLGPSAPSIVEGDHDQLVRALVILLDNAIRHTPQDGSIEVRTVREGGQIATSVVDSGTGIAPEDLPRIFDRFFRADASRGRGTGGAGLGLAIARSIAIAHHGEIDVASRLGEGSTFTLRLPLAAASEMDEAFDAARPPDPGVDHAPLQLVSADSDPVGAHNLP